LNAPHFTQLSDEANRDVRTQLFTSPMNVVMPQEVIDDYGMTTFSLTEQCLQEIVHEGIGLADAFQHSQQLFGIWLLNLETT
jgi:hypothetical protein